jgi:ribonuclease R
VHGDTVEVEKRPERKRDTRRGDVETRSRFRPAGRIVRVLERQKRTLVGLLMKSPSYWYVIPDNPRINQNIYIREMDPALPAKPVAGHKVVVAMDTEPHGEMLAGRVIESLGDPHSPGVDVLSILREHEIATEFSHETDREARAKHREPTEHDVAGRIDLRDEMIITIDPTDAKDHDDAVSVRRVDGGDWILGVHIADVSHFVTPGSAIDRDARAHGNSVYMVDRFIPMLPPYLTSEVCSLKAGRDRLAYSVFITYDGHGDVKSVEMRASVIHPQILLTYEVVQNLIVGDGGGDIPPQYHEHLHNMHELATILRRRRMRNGAVDLAMPEVSCVLGPNGRPISIKRRDSPEAYHLIEEFMLAANIAVAERLQESRVAGIYRIHEDPSEDQWVQMSVDLGQLGVKESPTDRFDIQRIMRAYQREALAYPVSMAILRNLKRAVYSAECIPHFGLAFDRYTHFTSPIRRYSDLVVHRILKDLDVTGRGYYSRKECEAIAEHCSRREREAAEAEEESLIIKRIQFYEDQLARGEVGPWPALVTGGTARGLLVELVDTLQRGFVPNNTLPDSDIDFDRNTGFVTGRKGRKLARIGDVVPVELVRVDSGRRQIELRWALEARTAAGGKGGGKRRQRRR